MESARFRSSECRGVVINGDPMQESVYETERQLWRGDMFRNDFNSAEDIAELMRAMIEDGGVRSVAPTAVDKLLPVIESGFSETHPDLFVSEVSFNSRQFFFQLPRYSDNSQFKCTRSMVGLKFPQHGRNRPVIAHETAHLLRFLELGFSRYIEEQDHGVEFQETYIEAVKSCIGDSEAVSLKEAFLSI